MAHSADRKTIESWRNTNQIMNRSNISGDRTASPIGGGAAGEGATLLPVRSTASRSQRQQPVPEGLTAARRQSVAPGGTSFAPRSQVPDWRSASLGVPGGGAGQSFAGAGPGGPQGWAGSVAPAPSGRGGGWAESQIEWMASSTGYQSPQSPAASTDEVYSLLNDEPAPSAFSWAAPTLRAGMGASTPHSRVQASHTTEAGSAAHLSQAVPGSGFGAWAESQMGRSVVAVAQNPEAPQSQTGLLVPPPSAWQSLQSQAHFSDGGQSVRGNERPASSTSFAAPSLQGGMLAGTQHSDARGVDGTGGSQASAATRASASGGAASEEIVFARPSVQELRIEGRISQEQFDRVADAVERGASAQSALFSVGRLDIPASSMRRWLNNAGVAPEDSSSGRRRGPQVPVFSETQIQTGLQAQADHIRSTGCSRGSARTAYEALGSNAGNWSTFRDYINDSGLTAHGQAMLRRLRSGSSRGGASNPGGAS